MVNLSKLIVLLPGIFVLNIVRLTISQREVNCLEDFITHYTPEPDPFTLYSIELISKLLTDFCFLSMLLF